MFRDAVEPRTPPTWAVMTRANRQVNVSVHNATLCLPGQKKEAEHGPAQQKVSLGESRVCAKFDVEDEPGCRPRVDA